MGSSKASSENKGKARLISESTQFLIIINKDLRVKNLKSLLPQENLNQYIYRSIFIQGISFHTPEIQEIEKVKMEAQTLESVLVSTDCDFVIGKEGLKVPVQDLVGKTVLLYFSAHWCPPCRAFLPKLIESYNKMKEQGKALEVVFISSDRDQTAFDEFFSTMPWLAIPFGDKRKESLSRLFEVRGIPMLVAIGPTGKTITTKARQLIACHGAEAYPFTDERLKEIEQAYEKGENSLS